MDTTLPQACFNSKDRRTTLLTTAWTRRTNLLTTAWARGSRSEGKAGIYMVALAGVAREGEVGREAGNPNLRVEVADVGGGVLVALRRVLSQQVRAHARRDARRHG